MPDDLQDWQIEYRTLRNRADDGRIPLSPGDQSRLQVLETKFQEYVDASSRAGEQVDALDEATGGRTLSDTLLSPPTTTPSPTPGEDGQAVPDTPSDETSSEPPRPIPRPPKPRPQSDDPFRPGYVDPPRSEAASSPEEDDPVEFSSRPTPSSLPPLPPSPFRYDDPEDELGHVYDPTDPKYAGSGVWDHLPEVEPDEFGDVPLRDRLPPPPPRPDDPRDQASSPFPQTSSGGSGGGGGIPIPVPVAGGSDDSGDGERGGDERSAREDPRGPWALEATTQARLTEIRDAIQATGKGKRVTGQSDDDEEFKRHPVMQEALNALDLAAMPGAGRNKSGQNLARYGQMVRGIGLRTGRKLRKLFGGGKRTKRDEDDVEETNDQSSKSKVDPKVVADVLGGGSPSSSPLPPPPSPGTPSATAGGATASSSAATSGAAVTSGAAGAAEGGLGAAGTATAGLAILAVAAFEAGKTTYAFARAQEQEVRKLAEYGGQQAVGVAELDAGRVRRDVETARETGDSSRSLTGSLDAFEEKLRPIETLLTNIANTVGGRGLDVLSQILTPLTEGAKIVNMIYDALPDWWKEDKVEDEVPFDRLKQIHDEMMRQNAPKFPMGRPNAPVPGAGIFDRF